MRKPSLNIALELHMMVVMIRKVAHFYPLKQKALLYEYFRLCSSTSMFPETFPVSLAV